MTADWNQAEIDAAVDAYVSMLQDEVAGRRYNKAEWNRLLRSGALAARSRASIEMRMCNISSVLLEQGNRYIDGYKPRRNVGSKVADMIRVALNRHDRLPDLESSPHPLSVPLNFTREHALAALARIDTHGFDPHSDSTTYDVLHDGKSYPPIAVVAFAIEADTGIIVGRGLLQGGQGTREFRRLKEIGLEPVHKMHQPTSDPEILDARVAMLHESEPASPLPPGNRRPRQTPSSESRTFERDPRVKRWVLANAKGICELCSQPSFETGIPWNPRFLEVHHVDPLHNGGPDTCDNTVALCPTCHRRCHHGTDAEACTARLYRTISRLQAPSPSLG